MGEDVLWSVSSSPPTSAHPVDNDAELATDDLEEESGEVIEADAILCDGLFGFESSAAPIPPTGLDAKNDDGEPVDAHREEPGQDVKAFSITCDTDSLQIGKHISLDVHCERRRRSCRHSTHAISGPELGSPMGQANLLIVV